MKSYQHKKKAFTFVAAFLFTLVGTYNAIVINSQSTISGNDIRFVKRLDEVYGVNKPARLVANTIKWEKISQSQVEQIQQQMQQKQIVVQEVKETQASDISTEIAPAAAAVQEELSLNLVEVINPNKWKNGLTGDNFTGTLNTNNGVIESLNVSLPNSEGLSVSFSEMTGNVFEYDMNGEIYSGMMFQVDQYSYMITLTNGPLEGTRLRFNQIAEPLPESADISTPGDFGNSEPQAEPLVSVSVEPEINPDLEAQVYNFNQQTL